MGTCAVTILKRDTGIGDHVEVTANVALSGSYATGGDTLTLASLGVKTLRALLVCGATAPATGHSISVVHGATEATDAKLMGRDVTTGAELGAASNNATSIVRVVAKGDHAYS